MTTYEPATPLRPSGYGGTGPSLSLALLDVARCYAIGAPPRIWLRGALNTARPPFSATC